MLQVAPARDRTWLAACARSFVPTPDVAQRVGEIVADVRVRGDAAIVEWARRVDDPQFALAKLRVAIPMQDQARSLVSPEIARALHDAKARMAQVYERERERTWSDADGTSMSLQAQPFESIAIYAPGGSTAHPSAILAGAVPARLAGVSRTIVLTPPRADGSVHPAVLFACSLCEIDELYAVGGAHAIAAAALGTASIERVQKIVGGRSPWVLEAKRQVEGACDIDAIAASPAAIVVADDDASSEFVAGDVLALAERGADASVVVVSESRPLLDALAQLLDTFDVKLLNRVCFLVHAAHRRDVFDVLAGVKPDRVALHVRDAGTYLPHTRTARAVFVGESSSIVAGEFLLPCTYAYAEFVRPHVTVNVSVERTALDAQVLASLAELEGLPFHAQSARMRGGIA